MVYIYTRWLGGIYIYAWWLGGIYTLGGLVVYIH